MINTNTLPASRNQAWGFYGSMHEHAEAAWPLAMRAIHEVTDESLDDVRAFLDSRSGRHFADEVCGGLCHGDSLEDAINAATRRWMQWTVGSRLAKQHSLPRGMAYLLAMVIHEGIQAENEDR